MKYLPYILIAFAAIYNATMDKLKDHFSSSVFFNMNQDFWFPAKSWNSKPKFLGWVRLDAWHIIKFAMLGCVFIAVSKSVVDFFIYCAIWGIFFECFYSYFLQKR